MATNTSVPTSFMEGLTIDSDTSGTDETVALTEPGDVEQESLKHQQLVSYIKSRFDRSKNKRMDDENRWLRCYRNYRGIYGPDVQFTETEKSQAFIKITKTKVVAAFNQIIEILSSGNKFPVGVEPAQIPKELAEAVYFDPKETPATNGAPSQATGGTIVRPDIKEKLGPLKDSLSRIGDKIKEGSGLTPSAYTWEPAKIAAKKMDKKFQDQFNEANAMSSLTSTAFEMALFGHGVYKGPIAKDKEYSAWSKEGEYQPKIKQIADFEFVSIWDSYPDPDARNMMEAEYFIQRHRMSKGDLRALKKRPFFRADVIDKVIDQGFNYIEEYWEDALSDYTQDVGTERFEVLEYWGTADADFEELTELKMPKQFKGMDQVQINAWICNGYLLRLVFNVYTPARIPYCSAPYELNPYSFFGIGVAENMQDTQLIMNGAFRQMIDNGILSGNVTFEVNENNLVPGQDLKLYPGKVFRTNAQLGQSIFSHQWQNVTQEWLAIYDKARQLADESTGIPSYAHGQGGVQGIGRTASGMSMLMGAAKENIKSVVRNIDDYILIPLGRSLFAFNMQFEFDKDFIGDIEVVARGTESLMRNEIRSQKILQFLQITANPMDAPFVKRDYLLRELCESLDLDSDKIVNDLREAGIQAETMKQMMIAQGIDPNSQGAQGGQEAAPGSGGSTDTTGGAVQPGASPTPGEESFSGTGGGSNQGTAPKGSGQ